MAVIRAASARRSTGTRDRVPTFYDMDETRSNKSRRTVLAAISRRLQAFYLFVQTNYAKDAQELFYRAEQQQQTLET
jgi:hypothetical protein